MKSVLMIALSLVTVACAGCSVGSESFAEDVAAIYASQEKFDSKQALIDRIGREPTNTKVETEVEAENYLRESWAFGFDDGSGVLVDVTSRDGKLRISDRPKLVSAVDRQ